MANHLLIEARKYAGLSQIQVAEQIGVTKATLNRWEQEKSFPYRLHRKKLCVLYQKTEQELGLLPSVTMERKNQLLTSFDALIPVLPETPLIGRDRELVQIKARLFGGNTVTLSALNGLPGVGKTALAITLAHDPEIREHFKDGILWAGLGPDPDLPNHLSHWGTLVGMSSSEMSVLNGHEAWAMALRHAIGSRTMLLVIDDAWTLEEALAFKVGGPHCAHLVTTRFPGVATQSMVAMTIQELNLKDSLTLLRELAPQVIEQERDRIDELVKSVGGLPLALHLLGNHLRKQASTGQPRRVKAALQRLNDAEARLSLSEPQVPAERHPSLQEHIPLSLHTVISVTIQPLAESVQAALFALSIFPPKPETFSETAALAVAACSEETLDALVDAGLLESTDASRYTLHQTIADYARLHLKAPHMQTVSTRLIAYVIHYVETHQNDYRFLDMELVTIFATLDMVYRSERHDALLHIVKFLSPFLIHRSLHQKIEPYLRRAYEIVRTQHHAESEADIARYLEQFAQVLIRLGEYQRAKTYLHEGLHLARQIGNAEQISLLLKSLGAIADMEGDFLRGKDYLLEGLAIAKNLQKNELVVPNLINLGSLCISLENYPLAFDYLQEALPLARQVGKQMWIGFVINNLLLATAKLGLHDQSKILVEEGLELCRLADQKEGLLLMLLHQASLRELQGDYEQAFSSQREALDLAQQIGDPEHLVPALIDIGCNAERQGNYVQSETYLQECLAIAQQVAGQESRLCWIFACLSHLAIKQGNYQQATSYCQKGIALDEHSQRSYKTYVCLLLSYRTLARVLQDPTVSIEVESDMQKALEFASDLNDRVILIKVSGIIGEIAALQGRYEKAKEYCERALELAKQFQAKNEDAWFFSLLSEIAIKQGNYQQAETFLHKGLQIAQLQSCPEYLGRTMLARGELAFQQQQMEAAFTAFQESIEIIPEANPLLKAQALYGSARVAAVQGHTRQARNDGKSCLAILEMIGHSQAKAVRAQLTSFA